MTNNLKEDEDEKCTEKNCLYKKYLSKDVLALLQKHDVTMWRLGCENHHFGLEIGAKVFSEFLEEYGKTLINQKEKEARLDELKNLMAQHSRTFTQKVTDSSGAEYVNESYLFISKYEAQERVEQLKEELKEKGK